MNSPIVITGMGMISPLGCGVKPVWQRLIAAKSGICMIDRFDTAEIPIKIAGLVPSIEDDSVAGFDVDQVIEKKIARSSIYLLYTLLRQRKKP